MTEDRNDAEQRRLDALDRYDVLDTPREESFDRIARLTKRAFNVPVAHISMIDGHRQWFKAIEGLDANEAPLLQTICKYAIEEGRPLIIRDASLDPRFAENPFVVGDPKIRFYAGMPLVTSEGDSIGTLCAVDTKPRDFSAADMETLSDLAQMVMSELELRRLAATDMLTGVMSRRAFKEAGERAASLALRHHNDLSCLALDLDNFKDINDRHGHAAGDVALVRAATAWKAGLRKSDLIGRLGGDEFVALLPHTGPSAALAVAEKLRSTVEALHLDVGGEAAKVTSSVGVASLGGPVQDFDGLLKAADAALYAAKAAGRNRCMSAATPQTAPASQRRRVLKGARILFNEGKSSMDCTVRSLSDDGAGIDVSSSIGVPKLFDLAIMADNIEKSCRTISRTEKHLDVEFC